VRFGWSRFLDPNVQHRLIIDEGEEIVDEVRKHPMAIAGALAGLVGCMLIFVAMPFAGAGYPIPLAIGLAVMIRCVWTIHSAHMDRFVITNMRVFRVHGIITQQTATMPMARILDITVDKPLLGQIFGYGHFVFESAAQAQGLREIRYVARPDERDLTIQRVIQRSGARPRMARRQVEEDS
jgi:membrane protein YdbS with pleckstrin-like domain